ncbi:hypothetical protein PMAYCL1PPCAC_32040, partial [Pristionchus mayeri]
MEGSLSTALLEDGESTRTRPGIWTRLIKFFDSEDSYEIDDTDPVPFFKLFRFASRAEVVSYSIACFINIIIGLVTPAYFYVISRLTKIYIEEKSPVGNDDFLWRVWRVASFYCIGFFLCITLEYIQHNILTWSSENIARRCRSAFVEAVLARESAQFSVSTGELSSQLSSHIDRLREGLAERIGLLVKSLSIFLSCCVISFMLDWQTALFLVWSGPIYILASWLITKLSKTATKETLKISEEANGI